MDNRLPAHLEVAAIRRLAESQDGFATILKRGDRDAGTIALVIMCRGQVGALYERLPQLAGNRPFVPLQSQTTDKEDEFSEILARRSKRDPDLWLIEVDVPDIARFVAALPA